MGHRALWWVLVRNWVYRNRYPLGLAFCLVCILSIVTQGMVVRWSILLGGLVAIYHGSSSYAYTRKDFTAEMEL